MNVLNLHFTPKFTLAALKIIIQLRSSGTDMRQLTKPSLVQKMAFRQFADKPLSDQCWLFFSIETIGNKLQVIFEESYNSFHSRKCLYENVVFKTAAMLSRPMCFTYLCIIYIENVFTLAVSEQRKRRLSDEQAVINSLITQVTDQSLSVEHLNDLDDFHKEKIREELLTAINILSQRVRQLKEVIVIKKRALSNVLKKVEGPWRESKLCDAISFLQTRIIDMKSCVDKSLRDIDHLGYAVAVLNGTDNCYQLGINAQVDLSKQPNFICLRQLNEDVLRSLDIKENCGVIKQRTTEWFELRSKANVTGSTLFNALGLSTLKEQREHVNKCKGIEAEFTNQTKENLKYGTEMEKHALATLVGKLMPVYYPHLKLREDGCLVMPMGNTYCIVSGDGSGVNINALTEVAFELKCPIPDKIFTTDTVYKLPLRYTCQVLSQMAAKGCQKYVNICYTPSGCTMISGQYDNDLWTKLTAVAEELYGASELKLPSKKHSEVKDLVKSLKEFCSSSVFIAEFPPALGVECDCNGTKAASVDEVYGQHTHDNKSIVVSLTLQQCAVYLTQAGAELLEAYNLLRRPAKEIIVTMASDLDRTSSSMKAPCAVPAMYCLGGYSLKMTPVRQLLHEVVNKCTEYDMKVRAIAFDGQFVEIAVSDDNGTPLTTCRLQKEVWSECKKLSKQYQISHLASLNHIGKITSHTDLDKYIKCTTRQANGSFEIESIAGYPEVHSPLRLEQMVVKTKRSSSKSDGDDECCAEDYILQHLPTEIIDLLDDESRRTLEHANIAIGELISKNSNEAHGSDTIEFSPVHVGDGMLERRTHDLLPIPEEDDLSDDTERTVLENAAINVTRKEAALCALIASSDSMKWDSLSLDEFTEFLSDPILIKQNFTVAELKAMLSITECEFTGRKLKDSLVNMVSDEYGTGGHITTKQCPKTLRSIILNVMNSWPKEATTALYATNVFTQKHNEWYSQQLFNKETVIETDDGHEFKIPTWYAQPSMINGLPVFHILDPHHLLVNNRCRCCAHGMGGMGIKKTAWLKVAEKEDQNHTGLSIELVSELRDRQRNAFAQATFSEAVENEMQTNGDIIEARWCRLIREFYKAVDESGIPIHERIQWLLNMREFLLGHYNPSDFPPPGAYVKGMPITQFEGILTNIDRRLQLYHVLPHGTYNHRSVSSLDCETFFGSFQVID